MTLFDLHGPWTGTYINSPPPYSVRRRKLYRVFFILAGVAIAVGALVAVNY